MDRHLIDELKRISSSMFSKNYFGVFHGSISAKVASNSFIINRKEAILDKVDEKQFIQLTCNVKKDYRWKDASVDANIHQAIYSLLPNAKYISYTMPPYTTAYSLDHSLVVPQDYYGQTILKEIPVYDPKNFNDWEARAPQEISNYLKNNNSYHLLLIKGFGLISYDRDLTEMVKKVAILENSCRLMTINSVN
jgi:L-fuculose-phosphate aldolase